MQDITLALIGYGAGGAAFKAGSATFKTIAKNAGKVFEKVDDVSFDGFYKFKHDEIIKYGAIGKQIAANAEIQKLAAKWGIAADGEN